jgi:hypothetical protein
MAISRFSTSGLILGLPKYQNAWDQDGVQQGAMVPIASVTVKSATDTSMGFTGIPQIYKDLYCVITSRRSDAVTEGTQFLYTGYSGTIASTTKLYGDGASVTSSRVTAQNAGFIGAYPGASSTAGIFGTQVLHILDYANTSRFKSIICRTASDRNGAGQSELSVTLFRDTGGLTSFGVSTYNASVFYVPGSTMTLYGIKAGA